jgi:hypothetical protein
MSDMCESFGNQFEIATLICDRFGIDAQPLRTCYVNAETLYNRNAVILQSLRKCCTIAARTRRSYSAITLRNPVRVRHVNRSKIAL